MGLILHISTIWHFKFSKLRPHWIMQLSNWHLLINRGDHREAAAFIRRLTYATFRQLVDDLPMSTFVESAMPHSLPILEAIYAKLFLNTGTVFKLTKNLRYLIKGVHYKVKRILKTWMDYCEDPARSCENLKFRLISSLMTSC